ncbi:hypothetical protein ABIA45_006426 [Bradyrhizobium sp. USDA 336]
MRGLRPTWPSEFRLKQNPFDFDDGPGASLWTGFQEPRGSHSGEFHWAFNRPSGLVRVPATAPADAPVPQL